MPLPAALLDRLKKRGIVPPKNQEEEVIAEDHDTDSSESESEDDQEGSDSNSSPRRRYKSVQTVLGCPNKVNIYHDCTEYCEEKYGKGKEVPSPRTERKYRTLLKRFPLPLDWLDVWEPGTYYFWNTETDEVSWLPPLHPKAKISMPVSKMRETLRPESGEQESESSDDDDSGSEESDSESSDDEPAAKKSAFLEMSSKGTKRSFPSKYNQSRQALKRNDLDPMDPAAYSESCPRGKWSDGLSGDKDE